MDIRLDDNRNNFLVQCAWCGAKIRDDEQEDVSGVCLQCFYQILSNHLSAEEKCVR